MKTTIRRWRSDGNKIWVAWQAYRDKADRVFLRSYENGRWAAPLEVTEKPARRLHDRPGGGAAAR